MHVCCTAGISGRSSEYEMAIVVIKKIPPLVCHEHLIGLLKILSPHVVVRALCRQDIVGDLLEIVCIKNVTSNRQNAFKRIKRIGDE